MPATDAIHQRRLKTFDPTGDLSVRAASLWRAIERHEERIARAFWNRYREHSDGRQRFDDAKMEQLVERILPYLREKFLRVGELKWVNTAGSYVEDAMAANVSLTTLLAGLSGEAEALIEAMRETYSETADRAEASPQAPRSVPRPRRHEPQQVHPQGAEPDDTCLVLQPRP